MAVGKPEDDADGERWTTRRAFLGAAAAASLAGCAEITGLPDGEQPGQAAGRTRTQQAGTEPPRPDESEFVEEVREQAHETGLRVRESVVIVGTPGGGPGGTGWVLDDRHIVTNSHVVAERTDYEVETFDGATVTAERVGFHRDLQPDVALLEADVSDVPALDLGSSESLSTDDPLVQVGHPASVGTWIIGLGRFVRSEEGVDWLLSTVPEAQGNSGSPLTTLDGEVVGVTSGGTVAGELPDYSRPTTVFEEYPEFDSFAVSVPVETLLESVESWT